MADNQSEMDKSEAATPFKLERAREKGNVARGSDIGFFATLVGIGLSAQLFGADAAADLATVMRSAFVGGVAGAADQAATLARIGELSRQTIWPVIAVGLTVSLLVIFVNIIQLRGLIFTTQPLKPDFSRLNPAKGLKRLFSMRMLKETAKSVLKVAAFAVATYILIHTIIASMGARASQGPLLLPTMLDAMVQMLILFLVIAAIFTVVDQLIVRKEFAKQMRMSRSEVKRENRDREGEPRQKQRRQQLHADYVKQQAQVSRVSGADMLIVNPEHYAIALKYTPATMDAPHIKAKGRNAFALQMRAEAVRRSVLIIENPPLARALHKDGRVDTAIPESSYSAVADLYVMKRRRENPEGAQNVQ